MTDDDFLAVHKLLSALEESDAGDSTLDLRISQCLDGESKVHIGSSDAALTAELAPGTVELILGEVVVPYTRSLDAALPGENIVFSMFSARRRQWVSVHRDDNGQEYVSWAATEPLARRAAALRGFKGISVDDTDADLLDLAKSEIDAEDSHDGGVDDMEEVDEVDEQSAWRVSF